MKKTKGWKAPVCEGCLKLKARLEAAEQIIKDADVAHGIYWDYTNGMVEYGALLKALSFLEQSLGAYNRTTGGEG